MNRKAATLVYQARSRRIFAAYSGKATGTSSRMRSMTTTVGNDNNVNTCDWFRPRRPSRYGLDRILSRAVPPRGPLDPNSLDLRREPFVLDADEDDYDDNNDEDKPTTNAYMNASFDPELTEKEIGLEAASLIHRTMFDRANSKYLDYENVLRDFNALVAPRGSTEALIAERRALLEMETEEEREEYINSLEKRIDEARIKHYGLGDEDLPEREEDELFQDEEQRELDLLEGCDIKPHHDWSETVIRVDRVQKVTKGGTILRYRCLVVGGNTKGFAGFGIGKANGPQEAAALASRLCKKNIFFTPRYLGSGLTHDLIGKHNSCRVYLRAVPPGYGLRGHDLIQEILSAFGISDCCAKSHGNRNIYNVVYATFKALLTHESIEDIAMKTGKRLINLERAKRLQLR
jgi:small subunit ribosomal protein S5